MTTPKPPADKPQSTKQEPTRATVVDAANAHRILFEGTEDDARDFVEQHAPRVHVDNGRSVPALIFVGPSGAREMYTGPESAVPWQPAED